MRNPSLAGSIGEYTDLVFIIIPPTTKAFCLLKLYILYISSIRLAFLLTKFTKKANIIQNLSFQKHKEVQIMITEMTKAEVTEIGARNRASYLLEQYGYTMGLAKLEGSALTDLLPKGYLDEVAATFEEVNSSRKDKVLAAEESKGSTQQVNDLLRQAKVWRRTIVHRAQRSKKLGKSVPDGLLTSDGITGVPGISTQLDKMVKLVEANQSNLPGTSLSPLIAEGQTLVQSIKAIDGDQEVKRLKSLPDAVRNFYHQKGLLYIGLKVINDAGRELHANNPSAAAKYNFSILYRNTHKKKNTSKEAAN